MKDYIDELFEYYGIKKVKNGKKGIYIKENGKIRLLSSEEIEKLLKIKKGSDF